MMTTRTIQLLPQGSYDKGTHLVGIYHVPRVNVKAQQLSHYPTLQMETQRLGEMRLVEEPGFKSRPPGLPTTTTPRLVQ